ncbi:hypothetical protein AUJ14_05710 [Candidatus Micrarchaeota archaeon CG1_02_55_22]|nr:MAG: hypothetical protein AUJ14_05710 [Candidatus Micrarchaeota archaeon CG1_02_55_22]
MAYALELTQTARAKIAALQKKNNVAFVAVGKKVNQVLENPYRFKPLKAPLQGLWRVHIDSSFILLYSIDESRKTVVVQNYAHHDEAYR